MIRLRKMILTLLGLMVHVSCVVGQSEQQPIRIGIDPSKHKYAYAEPIYIDITISNTSNVKQRILFDKNKPTTGCPWGMRATLVHHKGLDVVKYDGKGILESQAYGTEELERSYEDLLPKRPIHKRVLLTNIIVPHGSWDRIPKGKYMLQLNYQGHLSNFISFEVE